MSIHQTGSKNGMWKGGRTIASNGYVLIRVGKGHPRADSRGYAYEHRLVAAEKLGRSLKPGEIVHHIDGDKQNNAPDNLEVVHGVEEHRLKHRTAGHAVRLPGEPNPLIECGCGCKQTLRQFDRLNRQRGFIPGHNMKGGRNG